VISTTLITEHREIAPRATLAGPGVHRRGSRGGRLKRWSARHPAWPVTLLLAGYPAWWAMGLADESVIIMAIPMLLRMRSWQRSGRAIKVPPAFGLWLLFLVCVAAGVATLGLMAPHTVVSPLSNRLIAFVIRGLTYAALTILLLYVGNLADSELARRRLAWLLGLVGIYTTVGGVGGVVAPTFEFTSPMAYLLPQSLQANNLLQAALYPGFSQVTDILGVTEGRPKAPFEYTNTWGECLSILLPWLFVAWWSYGSRRQRKLVIITAAIALIPLVYSLNRGVWVGVGLTAVYLAVRLAARGKLAMLGVVCGVLVLVGVAIVATPLQGLITARLQHQQSNSIRASLSASAFQAANAAPLIGYGDTRHQQGSATSIAVGPSSSCPTCAQYPVGSNGQLYLLLVCDGWLGTALFLSFFAYLAWRYRRDKTPYGMAGVLVILLSFLYMFAYVSLTAPLEFTLLSVALLWRNDRWRRESGENRGVDHPGPARHVLAPISLRPVTIPAGPPAGRSVNGHGTSSESQGASTEGAGASAGGRGASRGSHRGSAIAGRSRPDRRLAEVARGGLLNMVGAGVAGLGTVVLTVIVTRSFSKAVAGGFFTAMSLFLIIEAVVSLGAATGTTYFIARLRSLGQQGRIPEVLRTATRPVAILSVAAAVVLALLATPAAHLLAHGQLSHAGARPDEVAAELRALAVALPFAAILDTLLGASRGYRAMGPTAIVDRIGRPLLQLAGVGAVAIAGSAALLAPLWALPYIPAAFIAWWWLRRIRRRPPPGVPAPRTSGPVAEHMAAANANQPLRFWRFTVPRGLATLAQITIQRIDIVLVAIILGPAEAAVYTAATRFLVAGQFANQAISMAAQPRFTEMFTQGDRRGANRVYKATTAWLILMTWPLYLLAVCYGPEIITVFGHSYRAGADVMVILGLTMLLATACGQVDMVLVTTGRSSWSLINGLLAVGVNVGLDLVLIPAYGITGAAIGWSAAIILTNLMPLAQVAASVRLSPFGRGTLITAALATLSFGVLPLAARGLFGDGVVPSLAAIAGGCVLMTAGIWRFRKELNVAAMPGTRQLAAARRLTSKLLAEARLYTSAIRLNVFSERYAFNRICRSGEVGM
jgi:O-antigen/teichoic acid export membrane protein